MASRYDEMRSYLRHLLLVTAFITSTSSFVLAQSPSASAQGREKSEETFPRFEWGDHPSLRLGRGTRIDLRLRLQLDVRGSEAPFGDDDELNSDAVDLARRRLGIEGEILNIIDYEIERELATTDGWRDVYANYKQFAAVQVQAGKFKVPFSLDENTSATNLDFVHRSRAAEFLAPGRDVGVQVHGRVARRRLRYEAGLFRHDGSNARTNDLERVYAGRTFAGRVRTAPFRLGKGVWRDLEVGVAMTSGDVPEGQPGLRGRTVFDERFYRPDVFVRGARRRLGFEGQWRPGPFSVKAELIRLTQERSGQSVEDTDLSALIGRGWYVSGTWAVTGERKADGLDNPRRPLFRGGPGAVELAVRVESLRFESEARGTDLSAGPRANEILGNADRAVTLGVNWYANRWVKLQLNGIRETIRDPFQGPLPEKPSFWSTALRFQLTI